MNIILSTAVNRHILFMVVVIPLQDTKLNCINSALNSSSFSRIHQIAIHFCKYQLKLTSEIIALYKYENTFKQKD